MAGPNNARVGALLYQYVVSAHHNYTSLPQIPCNYTHDIWVGLSKESGIKPWYLHKNYRGGADKVNLMQFTKDKVHKTQTYAVHLTVCN